MPLQPARGGKIDPKFEECAFLGVIKKPGEAIISTSQGAVRSRTVRRVSEETRWSAQSVKSVVGTPAPAIPVAVGMRPAGEEDPLLPPPATNQIPFRLDEDFHQDSPTPLGLGRPFAWLRSTWRLHP